jgi:hypothetical protein|tara:strand:- start:306 stop:488 length:183 start_codon:yes stop_codon:yes gene_type:complete
MNKKVNKHASNSPLEVPRVAIKNPLCAIELKTNIRFIRFCFKAEKVPTNVVKKPNKRKNG